ncbi:MAG: PGPGW domain-containing protein [Candidatus Binatia bacterium]
MIIDLEKLKRNWRRFKSGSPGHRFQQQFSRRRQSSRSPVQKALFIGGGTLLMTAGLFFLFVPGPGLLILLLGAVLIAQQSLVAARALDWTEIRLRKLIIWSLRAWRSSSPALKIMLVVLALVVVGAVGFGAFKF